MEAVPRLPMVEFELKSSPENVDFASKIRQLIMSNFGEDPASFSKEIKELETLRANSCIRVAESIDGIATLKKYFCQLTFLKSRFKVGAEGPFQFSWRDVYSGADFAVSDINYELASVLYNLGALHTKLGGKEQRQDSEGMKMAVAHFQCAAWAFHTLPDKLPQDPESDLSSELLALKSQVCLAQAQECILEKSILDSRKPNIVAKVCSQVVEYYRQALRHLDANGSRDDHMDSLGDIVGSKQMKSWRIFLDFKAAYYSALCSLHSGMVSEESQRFGERVAHYQAASDSLVLAGKLGGKLENPYKEVAEALAYTSDVIHGKLDNAKKENEFIYHEKVPEKDSLQPVKGASLVKGIGWEVNDPEVSGPDLFSRLVPLEAHLGGSLYSEEQAKLLRTVCGQIEEANDTITVYLASLQLEDIPTGELDLPQELIECCAGLSVRRNAVPQLQEAMAKLASVSSEVESSLAEIQAMLKEDEEKEGEFQAVVGNRPKSIVAELERETRKYHEAHSIASESNLTLHKAMQLHVKNLKLLGSSMEEIQAKVPSLNGLEPTTQSSLDDMRAIIGKVAEMRSQRAQLEGELRASVQNDDITESLARRGNKDQEKVFEEELKKHDKTVAFIKQNIAAQENIIRAMTERNAEYADARVKVDNVVRAREDMIGSLVASYHAYEDLLTKTTKGLEFYDKLEANVSKLLARVGGVVKVQEEERTAQLNSSAMKAADAHALSLRLVAGQGVPPPSGSPVPRFPPGAPPPDTPERTPPFIPPPSVNMPGVPGLQSGVSTAATGTKSRPKLSDYLNARKETKKTEGLDNGGNVAPGVRPQPLGEESGPATSSYSTTQNSVGLGFYTQAGPSFTNPGQASQLLLQQQQLQAILGQHHQKQQQVGQNQWPVPPATGSASPYALPHTSQFLPSSISAAISQSQPVPQRPSHPASYSQPSSHSAQQVAYPGHQTLAGQHVVGQQGTQAGQQHITPNASQVSGSKMQMPSASHQSAQVPQQHALSGQPLPRHQGHPNQYVPQPGVQSLNTVRQPFPVGQPPLPAGQHSFPTGQPPLPAGQQPLPTGQQSLPTGQQSLPTGQQPLPAGQQPLPAGQQPLPAGQQPLPTEQQPLPAGHFHPELQHPNVGQHTNQGPQYASQPKQPDGHQIPGYQQQAPAISQPATQKQSSHLLSQHPQPQQQAIYFQHQAHPQQQPTHPQQHAITQQPRPTLPAHQEVLGQNLPGYYQASPAVPGQKPTGHERQEHHQAVLPQQQIPHQAGAAQTTVQQYMSPGQNINSPQMRPLQASIQPNPQTPSGHSSSGSVSQTPPHQAQQLPPHTIQAGPMAQLQHQQQLWQSGRPFQHSPGGSPAPGHQAPQTGLQQPVPNQVSQSVSAGCQQVPGQHGNPGQVQAGHQVPGAPYQQQIPLQIAQPGPSYYQPQQQLPKQQQPQQQQCVPKDVSAPTPGSNLALLSDISLSAPTPAKEPVSPPPPSRPVVPQPGTASNNFPLPPTSLSSSLPSMSSEEHLAILAQHRDKLADVVNGLGQQGWLEKQWKEVLDTAEAGEKRSVSVARCYPDMNRTPDVLPYDQTRVELKGWKDDYINASRIASFPNNSSVSGAVVTQAPQARYLSQFWGLVWQEGVEVLVCLVPDHDLGGVGVYLPQEKEKKDIGNFIISTFSCKKHPTYVERVVNVMNKDGGSTRALVHLQMIGWQGPDLPVSPAPLVDTALAVLEQKSRSTILVHCLEGSSKSGTFLSLLWLIAEMEGKALPLPSTTLIWPPVVQAMAHVVRQRKGIVRDRQYIGLVYQALLHYCNHTLGKAGMSITPTSNSTTTVLPTVTSEHFPVQCASPSPAPSSVSVPEMELVEPPKQLDQKDQVQSHHDELASLHLDTQGAESCPASGSVFDSQGASPKIPTDLSKLADISLTESPKKQKITKEDFLRPSTGLVTKEQNPKDPLDMLDPLWSLK